ncbi:MAG: hypothetical protein ACE5NJ_05185 [Thermodesulfobacteriota bacterium]
MNTKRFIIASVVVFVVYQVIDYLVNGVILMGTYEALKHIWRPEADMKSLMWIFYPIGLVVSFLFVYIFIKGYEGKGILEGLRYGIWIGLFVSIPGTFSQYVIYPIPFSLAIQWFIYWMIQFIIIGLVAAAIYKPKA